MLRHLRVTVEGHAYDVTVEDLTDTGNQLYPDHRSMTPTNATAPVMAPAAPAATPVGGVSTSAAAPAASGTNAGPGGEPGATAVLAPMSGVVVEINVGVGDSVQSGQVVAVMEAMKLKSPIVVGTTGTVATIDAAVGDAVESGASILTLS
ncbi:acetyl-CoA carboxylase biotin carboxyl carrier protein subunit [Mobilicoccus pelagius]|uniref:Putative Na(+)-transporting decarboxylase biotin carrier protein n=1 Tax=Mobilicoccus pelagius NBRC 104925 TaxID=1089455 RepID=H5UR32_9MICO|nr:acetyl-CoA carboxylase biotin carboxyl carrier protein subunit [Mobilicoccus pelagius]GAB48190.1 putative Na(+)-transporting decarboxylase biotin carrier protein [Mobilicoccus pelagius NBRC 104925]